MSIDPWEVRWDWIVPLTEPLRIPPWKVPLEQWEKVVSLPELPVPNSPEPSLMDRVVFYRQAKQAVSQDGMTDR
jgi:hypothetical protein